jgi:hypothetical protein
VSSLRLNRLVCWNLLLPELPGVLPRPAIQRSEDFIPYWVHRPRGLFGIMERLYYVLYNHRRLRHLVCPDACFVWIAVLARTALHYPRSSSGWRTLLV